MDSSPFIGDDDIDREEDEVRLEISDEDVNTGSKRKGSSSSKGKKKSKKNSGNTRSEYWEHYTRLKDNNEKCNCNYCGREMGCSSANGTSNLKKHLKCCKAHIAWKESRVANTQSVIEKEPEGALKLTKVSEAVCREATNELIVLAELPLSFIEGVGWLHFCNKVKLHKPVSRRTSTRDIYEMFAMKKAQMMKVIKENKQRVSITTDIWTAPTTAASCMVITCHFVGSNWKLKKLIIGFKQVKDHKGKTISKVLLDCLVEWGIKRIFTITVDNATANSSALRKFKAAFMLNDPDAIVLDGQFMHMRCCAHIINLIVKDGLKELDSSYWAIRNAIQYVRASTNRVDEFDKLVESAKVTRGSLPLDVKTRWNSTFLMFEKAVEFKVGFDKTAAKDKLYNDHFQERVEGKKRVGPPTADDWDEVVKLMKFLEIFYDSTLVVSQSSVVGSYQCYNEIVTIQKNLNDFCESDDEKLREMALVMREKFGKYWGGIKEINKLIIVASVLDPRNKMKFPGICFDSLYGKDSVENMEITEIVNRVLKELFDQYSSFKSRAESLSQSQSSGTSQTQSGQDSQSQEPPNFVNSRPRPGYQRMDFIYKEMVNDSGFQDSCNELELYLKENVENPKPNPLGIPFDVLGWWKKNSAKYPVLSSIAKDVLAMQVSSVASESAFSTSNRILDPFRSCLTPYTLEALMCTEQWLKCEICITEKGVITNEQILADFELQDSLQKVFEGSNNAED